MEGQHSWCWSPPKTAGLPGRRDGPPGAHENDLTLGRTLKAPANGTTLPAENAAPPGGGTTRGEASSTRLEVLAGGMSLDLKAVMDFDLFGMDEDDVINVTPDPSAAASAALDMRRPPRAATDAENATTAATTATSSARATNNAAAISIVIEHDDESVTAAEGEEEEEEEETEVAAEAAAEEEEEALVAAAEHFVFPPLPVLRAGPFSLPPGLALDIRKQAPTAWLWAVSQAVGRLARRQTTARREALRRLRRAAGHGDSEEEAAGVDAGEGRALARGKQCAVEDRQAAEKRPRGAKKPSPGRRLDAPPDGGPARKKGPSHRHVAGSPARASSAIAVAGPVDSLPVGAHLPRPRRPLASRLTGFPWASPASLAASSETPENRRTCLR